MLTSTPPRLLHVVRDAAVVVRDVAAAVVVLADLGLELLCGHDGAIRRMGEP